ncbi:hypothetical protein PG994_011237 [Apiospora phragmitis]|uniref:Uncharacterized protein n=1 Tax=Apiospora phragmitis TaxID=2905665 RepID=A0ABR1TSJ7_9PEZI
MPKQPDPPSPSKPVPTSWWFLTGGVGAPLRSRTGFHRLASERKAAHRAEATAKRECGEAKQARKDALAKLEEEHGPLGAREVEGEKKGHQRRQQRQRLGRKELMERYGPDSGVKAGRGAMAMATPGSAHRPQDDVSAGGSGDQAPADRRAEGTRVDEAGADNTGANDTDVAADHNAPVDGASIENAAD